jgi:hypothetical protein
MLKLQTKVAIPEPDFKIDYKHSLSFYGSCFSENIGSLLQRHKFNAVVNPFGVLYNPASISQVLDLLMHKEEFTESDLEFYNEKWFSFYHHTSFSAVNKQDCLLKINSSFEKAKLAINKTDFVFITIGTSWVYRYKTSGAIVSNCHKLPAKEFVREYLDPDQIAEYLSTSIKQIISTSPQAKIIFTVSPIRHLKDGAIENMRSKASLILAIKLLQELFAEVFYFPAYEIFMDELRDYRFYTSDMMHPSEFSIEYIWAIFKQTFFTQKTNLVCNEAEKLIKAFGHRVIDTDTDNFRKFRDKLLKDTIAFEQKYPSINFTEEKKRLL